VTGPNSEIYSDCVHDDGTFGKPTPDSETGAIPCDTTPPMTLGPGCIGYDS